MLGYGERANYGDLPYKGDFPPLVVVLSADPIEGEKPLTTELTAEITGEGPFTWELDFDDGTANASGTGSSVTVSHTYTDTGVYNPTITAHDAYQTSHDTITITATAPKPANVVVYVDFNRITNGHAGTYRDNFSFFDLQTFFDYLPTRSKNLTEVITIKCRGRCSNALLIYNLTGEPGNLIKFESSDPVNDPAILAFDTSQLITRNV